MLPFLTNRDDASVSGPPEVKEREHDEDFDFLGAIAEDLISAVHAKDAKLVRSALEALCEHIQDLDAAQDSTMETT